MKKIKLLTPILGISALSSAIIPLTSCSCGQAVREATISPTLANIATVEVKLENGNEIITITAKDITKRFKNIFAIKIGERVLTNDEFTFDVNPQTITITKDVLDKYQGSINIWPGDLEFKPILKSIDVTTHGTESFKVGEKFNHDGLVITATYKQGEETITKDVTNQCIFTCEDLDLKSEFKEEDVKQHTIVVTFEGKVTTYTINVTAAAKLVFTVIDATTCKVKAQGLLDEQTITIPEKTTINDVEYTVVEIEPDGFKDQTNINSVSMSDTVTKIGAGSFSGCNSLTSVDFGNKMKPWTYSSSSNVSLHTSDDLSANATFVKSLTTEATKTELAAVYFPGGQSSWDVQSAISTKVGAWSYEYTFTCADSPQGFRTVLTSDWNNPIKLHNEYLIESEEYHIEIPDDIYIPANIESVVEGNRYTIHMDFNTQKIWVTDAA